MDVSDRVEVVVDEVIRIASPDEGWGEFSEVARTMGTPDDPEERDTPVPAVLLMRETGGERVLPIYIGLNEAFSIWLTITGGRSLRPMTHDLMLQVMGTVDLRVEDTTVSRLAQNTFYTEILMSQNGNTYQVDARPSDAIALAVRLQAPIYANRQLFDEEALASKRAWPNWHREQFGKDAPHTTAES